MRKAQVELVCENILGTVLFNNLHLARLSLPKIMEIAAVKAFQDRRIDENAELLRIAMRDMDAGKPFEP